MAGLYKRGPVYWIIYYEGGRKIQKSLKTKDRTVAKFKKNEIENQLSLGDSPLSLNDTTARKALDDYEKYCLARNVKKTVHDDIKRIRDFLEAGRISRIAQISVANLSSYLDTKVTAKKIKKSTANRTITNVKTWLNFCIDRNFIRLNPIARIKTYRKLEKNPVRFYHKDQYEALLNAAKELGPDHLKMVAIGIFAGLRVSELMGLEWPDIDFDRRIIRVVNKEGIKLKSRKFRIIPLHERLGAILATLRQETGLCVFPERNFTTAPKYHLYQIQKKAGLKEEGFHILRHTFGARLTEEGVSAYKIKEWMGHSSLRMTEIYMHLTPKHDEEINRI